MAKVWRAFFLYFLTVHLGTIRVNNQLDALFNVFIALLYMFRKTQCSSSGESIVSIRHLVYRLYQEECARLRESVPYFKVHRYNPKHLCLKLNGYGDNGQRKVLSSGGSTHCTCQLTALSMLRRWVWYHMTGIQLTLAINRMCTSFRMMT